MSRICPIIFVGLLFGCNDRKPPERTADDEKKARAADESRLTELAPMLEREPDAVRQFVLEWRPKILVRPIEFASYRQMQLIVKYKDYFNTVDRQRYFVDTADALGAERHATILRLKGDQAIQFKMWFAMDEPDSQTAVRRAIEEIAEKGYRKSSVETKNALLNHGYSRFLDKLDDYP